MNTRTAISRTFETSDGLRLHFRHWPAVAECRGIIVALHGIQSHSGWYDYSSRRLAESGFDVYFADRRGSGLNNVQRGHADHGLRLLNDVRQLVRLARRERQQVAGHHTATEMIDGLETWVAKTDSNHMPGVVDVPVTLLGLSWGGKLAAAFAATFPNLIDRLVLLYPALKSVIQPSVWQTFQLNFARRHDIRHHPVPIPLRDPGLLTSHPDWQKFIRQDPLALHHVTSGFLNAGRDLDNIIRLKSSEIRHPLLLMLAGQDRIIDNQGTQQCVARFGCRTAKTIIYPDAEHTLEFERCCEQFVTDLLSWLSYGR